jgi:hypothetical protein
MTSLRGWSIRVIVRSTGGVECGDADIRRAVHYLSRMALERPVSEVAILSASRLDFVLRGTLAASEHDNFRDNVSESSPQSAISDDCAINAILEPS